MSLRKVTAGAVWGLAGIVMTLLSGCGGSDTSIGPGANTTSKLRAVNMLVCANYNSVNFAQRISTVDGVAQVHRGRGLGVLRADVLVA